MITEPAPIVILGPTAGGKSQLAVNLAERLGGEVIGADSMQVYRRLDAGTAKPSARERRRVPHHLIDIVEPTERFTVADWLQRADDLVARLRRSGRTPIIVGGTNLYIKALFEGLFEGPAMDAAFRAGFEDVQSASLHRRLEQVDGEAAGRIHPNDRRRIIRALEVLHLTGSPISHWQQQWHEHRANAAPAEGAGEPPGAAGRSGEAAPYRHGPMVIGLRWPLEAINLRINQRVRAMFYPDLVERSLRGQLNIHESLPQEVERLHALGQLGEQSRQAIGYKEVIEFIEGRCTLEEAFERTKILTRRFAKQQRTWLRRFRGVRWIEPDRLDSVQVLETAIEALKGCQ